MLLALLLLAVIAVVVVLPLTARALGSWRKARARRRTAWRRAGSPIYDPGRERRAEQRARELLRSCVNEEEWAMYRDLGFIRVSGRQGESRPGGRPRYAYLIYPHKPIVSFVPKTGQLLSEYCVEFPDLAAAAAGRSRLPASDDVLAKWMALTSDEARVLRRGKKHPLGPPPDPARGRRGLWRLPHWGRRRRRRRRSFTEAS